MADYDLMCPLGYGAIRFVGGTGPRGGHCPVSGATFCSKCDVQARDDLKKTQRVKKEGERA